MKIVHLIYSFTTGGTETMLVDIINSQVKKNSVHLIVVNDLYHDDLILTLSDNVKIHKIDRSVGSKNPFKFLYLNFLLIKFSPNVIHCHNHNGIGVIFPVLRKNVILTIHDTGVSSSYFSKYSKLISISESVKNDLFLRTGFYSDTIYNGIPLNSISKKYNYLNPSKDSIFKIVIVSRLLHQKKGQDLAIKALESLISNGNTNIRLDLIGDGVSESYLKELVIRCGLSSYVSFLGLKTRNYVYTHLKDYDLLLQPSRYEGFGLTVVEGIAAGIPVLVSDIEGPMEIIQNGKFGYFFKSDDLDDLISKLDYIISVHDSDLNSNLIFKALQHVKKNFNINITVNKYLDYYKL